MVELIVFCILMDEDSDLIKKLYTALPKYGFTYVHNDQINNINNLFKSILNADIINIPDSEISSNSLNVAYTKESPNGLVLMEPNTRENNLILELSLFSSTPEDIKLLKSKLESVLFSKEIKLKKKNIFYGSLSEIKYVNTLKRMKDHSRSELVKTIDDNYLKPFLNSELREKIKTFASFPISSALPRDFVISESGLNDTEISQLLSVNIMNKLYTIYCTKCTNPYTPLSFHEKEDLETLINKSRISCPSCGSSFNSKNSQIVDVFNLTDVARECVQGLWLEAFIKSLIDDLVPLDKIKACAYYERNEIDIAFIDSGELYVCECKDTRVGQNDAYILAVKSARMEANNVFLISTEEISKEVISTLEGEERRQFIPIYGDALTIKKQLLQRIHENRNKFKEKKTNELVSKSVSSTFSYLMKDSAGGVFARDDILRYFLRMTR